MSRCVNKVILVGHLGRNAETSYTAAQIAVSKFSIATSRRWKDKQSDEWKEQTDWTNVILWRNDKLAQYLTKGQQVYVEGRIQTRSYDKDGAKHWVTEVIADEVILLGKPDSGKADSSRPAAASGPPDGITDDDVPF